MKDIGLILALGLIIIACVAIGAWLVVEGHPFFGFLAMLVGGSISYHSGPSKKDDSSEEDKNAKN